MFYISYNWSAMKKLLVLGVLLSTFVLVWCNTQTPQEKNDIVLPEPELADESDTMEKSLVMLSSERNELTVNNFTQMQLITSPLTITGEVPSEWVFEWSFPITLFTNWWEIIAESYGTANIFDEEGEIIKWSVPFEAVLEFEAPDLSVDTWILRFSQDPIIAQWATEDPEVEPDLVETMVLFE